MMAAVDLDSITLAFGGHASREDGMCLLEAVAYIAGEPHTDHPQCVCPVLAAFGRTWNDSLDDDDRDRLLKPFIPLLVGTRSTREVERQRGRLAADWAVRVYTPVWLRAAGLAFDAAELEALAPLRTVEACRDAWPAIAQARKAAFAAREAARSAATATARNAAKAAARASARAAALDAADAARPAAVAAAMAAARDVDWDVAAGAAARAASTAAEAATDATLAAAAAGVALRPHVERLQNSAVDLYRQMIEVAA